jgi:hypothetical protein
MQCSVLWPAGLLCMPRLATNTRLIRDILHSIPNSTHGYYLSSEAGIIRFILEQKLSTESSECREQISAAEDGHEGQLVQLVTTYI